MKIVYDVTVEDFNRLHVAAGWKPLDIDIVKKSLDGSMFKISILEDDKCIGMARILGDYASHGLLCDVIVAPEYQGKGYGTKMLKALTDKVQEFVDDGRDEFLLELCPTYGNEKFYERCGLKNKPESMAGMYKWYKNSHKYIEGSKKYSMKLKKEPFDNIASGNKTIEMRLFDEKRALLKSGDFLYFYLIDDYSKVIKTVVRNIYKFNNFDELYKAFDKKSLGYKDDETANPEDMKKYYSASEIDKYGTCAIELEIVK